MQDFTQKGRKNTERPWTSRNLLSVRATHHCATQRITEYCVLCKGLLEESSMLKVTVI